MIVEQTTPLAGLDGRAMIFALALLLVLIAVAAMSQPGWAWHRRTRPNLGWMSERWLIQYRASRPASSAP